MQDKRKDEKLMAMQKRYWDGLADCYQERIEIATDDFHYGPQIAGERKLHLLPPFNPGQTALELGCGGGQNSLWLAKHGMACTAIDISEEQLRHARTNAQAAGMHIRYLRLPIEQLRQQIHETFDFVHSSHAFEFVEDPGRCVKLMADCLRPDGTLMISTVHPLYNGEWVEQIDLDGEADGMGLFLRSYFEPPDDTRCRDGHVEVISRAYPISAWFNWLREAGLEVVRLEEPAALPAAEKPPYTSREWADHEGQLEAMPSTLILVGRKR